MEGIDGTGAGPSGRSLVVASLARRVERSIERGDVAGALNERGWLQFFDELTDGAYDGLAGEDISPAVPVGGSSWVLSRVVALGDPDRLTIDMKVGVELETE